MRIKNTKDTNLGSLSLSVYVKAYIEDITDPNNIILERILSRRIIDSNIKQDSNFLITVLDLTHVPTHVKIYIQVESFIYTAIGSKDNISDFSGESDYNTTGNVMYEASVLSPQRDKQ